MAFDLDLFRGLAFERRARPDHPIGDEAQARKMVQALPGHDPSAALAELTHWAVSMNEESSFTPDLRARILMEIDLAAHPFWRSLGVEFLAPGGKPSEGVDGNPGILHALRESAAEFANGYRLSLTPDGLKSRWMQDNLAMVLLRRTRWHARKMQFSRMLRQPGSDAGWAELHELYHLAEEHGVLRKVNKVFPGNLRPSSMKQEYVRPLLGDIARPDRFLGREFELMFRVIGRISSSVQLEQERLPGALHAVVPELSHRPVTLSRHAGSLPESALYIDITNAIPRLKALLERHMDIDPAQPDPEFDEMFTVRERRSLIEKLIAQWTANAPQRRVQRIALKSLLHIHQGFEDVAKVMPDVDQGDRQIMQSVDKGLRIQLGADERKAQAPRAVRLIKGELHDASTSGMGVVVDRSEVRWARIGALVAVCVQPGRDWVVGVVRRANDVADQLRLGVALLSRKPRLLWFRLEGSGYKTVWEAEKRYERNFLEQFQRGILMEADQPPFSSGEMLLPPGLASRGTRFDVPMHAGMERLLVTAVREETQDFQRVAYERSR